MTRLPLVVVRHRGECCLLSMLGPRANWVLNVEASGGRAVWEQGRRRAVRLPERLEVPPADRAPILRRRLRIAWSARAQVAVPWNAPLPELAGVAADHPVYRIMKP